MKLYDETAAKLSRTTDIELKRMQSIHDEFVQQAAKAKQELETRTQDYIESGIAYNTTALQTAFNIIHDSDVKGYFKKLAKELDRPFVYAEDTKDHAYYKGRYQYIEFTELTVPATNRLKGVVAGLNMVANPRGERTVDDVIARHSERTWRFEFSPEGRHVLLDFIKTCRDNPVLRITLGVRLSPTDLLTPGGHDVTS
jgi:hypothetical protein